MEQPDLITVAKPIVWRRGHQAGLSAEDLLQDVLAKYLVAWREGAPDNVAAWFETTTSNAIIDRARVAEGTAASVGDSGG